MPPLLNRNHPGESLRKIIAKNGLNISKSAALLGVSRPPLSNLLNGKAGLSLEMAQRFATAFPADADEILALQSAYEQAQGREQAKEMMVRTYMPSFLAITARQIHAWADGNVSARAQLPALLRRLVHGAGVPLSKVDFPAFDNAQRHGWDGQVAADAASPWLARGESGWEFGCDKDPAAKAEKDYQNRKGILSADVRASIAFVFVTPRNWPGKEAWAQAKRNEAAWKDVRAFDASDLEQWLEQCPAAQAWFAELIGSSQLQGLKSLESAWAEWANAATPPLPKLLFRRSVETKRSKLQEWLKRIPGEPLVVAADSSGEAIAFIACALEDLGQPAGRDFDGALVVEGVEALQRVAALGANLILITASSEVEQAYASLPRPPHLIVARRRNSLAQEPHITLDLVDEETFRAALEVMGLHQPDFHRYSAETANSPTILRRRLAKVPSLKTPAWSADEATARALIPLIFAGAWDIDKPADLEIMRCLTNQEAAEIEQTVRRLDAIEDAPTWSIGRYRGVTSKIDALFATHRFITQTDLENFLLVAHVVLSEEDPAQDLPEERKWAAGIYGKTREHSSALRRGLCETLVLLAAHGNDLLRRQLTMDVEAQVSKLVRDLLTPLDNRTWTSQRRDLPRYAEAGPDTFLNILEQDLASSKPKVLALMQSADNTLFGDCPRSGLLWALERLAWKPDHLLRVSRLLARLSEVHISDNWANTPKASLAAIYRNWMPQTAASIDSRNAAMAALCRDYPRTGWRLIIGQLGSYHAAGHYSDRPEWRNDASGAGEPVETNQEIILVAQEAMRLALTWPEHDEHTFGDLIDHMPFIPESEQKQIWAMILVWAKSDISDGARHQLRERIRDSALSRRAQIRGSIPIDIEKAREAYRLLTPQDLLMRHLWLFENSWVDGTPDDEDDEYDFRKHEARISALRRSAMAEIWDQEGYHGLIHLSTMGDANWPIGLHLPEILPEKEWTATVDRLVRQDEPGPPRKVDLLVAGFLAGLQTEQRHRLIAALLDRYHQADEMELAIRLLKVAPFRAETWTHLVNLPAPWQVRYWHDVQVQWHDQAPAEMNILVERLIAAGRPRAAFQVVHMDFDKVETKLLAGLLRSVATSESEPIGHHSLDQHRVSQAFKSLSRRFELDRAELIQLEFLYAEALDQSEYGIPTLEDALGKEPQLFVQLVAAVYRRQDDDEDPPEWRIDDGERRSRLATVAYKILRRFTRLPGSREDGTVDPLLLRRWVDAVRTLGAEVGRTSMTDHAIGEMFGRTAAGSDGVWPCPPVRDVFDAIASIDMAAGMRMGRHNARGAHWRAPGGGQERALSDQYRAWGTAVVYQHPFTAKFLNEMAKQYDREAEFHDTEHDVRKRIGY